MSTTVTLTVEQDGIELQMKLTPEDHDGPAPTIEQLIEQAGLSALAAMADFNLFAPDAPLTDLDSLDGGDTWIKNPEPDLDTDEEPEQEWADLAAQESDEQDMLDDYLAIEQDEEPITFVAPSVDKGSDWSTPQPAHYVKIDPSVTGDLRTGLGPIQ